MTNHPKMTSLEEWYPLCVKWPATIAHYKRICQEKWGEYPRCLPEKERLTWKDKPK